MLLTRKAFCLSVGVAPRRIHTISCCVQTMYSMVLDTSQGSLIPIRPPRDLVDLSVTHIIGWFGIVCGSRRLIRMPIRKYWYKPSTSDIRWSGVFGTNEPNELLKQFYNFYLNVCRVDFSFCRFSPSSVIYSQIQEHEAKWSHIAVGYIPKYFANGECSFLAYPCSSSGTREFFTQQMETAFLKSWVCATLALFDIESCSYNDGFW